LTLAQEFREARAWFAQHKRDPFLWLVILGPLTFFVITPWWGVLVFPSSDAIRAISQTEMALPVTRSRNTFQSATGKRISLGMISTPGRTSVVHAETLLTVDGLSISYFEDEPGRQSAAKLLSKERGE